MGVNIVITANHMLRAAYPAMLSVAKSILENWYYWILLNLLSIILFHLQELYLTEILFLFNFCMSVFGLLYWKKLAAIPK